MKDTRAATRYASALLGVAIERKELDTVDNDLRVLEGLIRGVPEFALFLRSPVISKERKKKTLSAVCSKRLGGTTFAFVILLAAKDREALLPEIIRRFGILRDEHLGIINVAARTAVKFTQGQEKQLSERLQGVTGKKVRLRFEEDPSLVGGFTIQYEDTVWDASIARQLELLRERLIGGI